MKSFHVTLERVENKAQEEGGGGQCSCLAEGAKGKSWRPRPAESGIKAKERMLKGQQRDQRLQDRALASVRSVVGPAPWCSVPWAGLQVPDQPVSSPRHRSRLDAGSTLVTAQPSSLYQGSSRHKGTAGRDIMLAPCLKTNPDNSRAVQPVTDKQSHNF